MRIVRFSNPDGLVQWGKLVDSDRAVPMVGDPFGHCDFRNESTPIVRRFAPVDPPNILAVGRNYPEHAEEMKAASPEMEPLVFLKATTSVIGPDEAIILPPSAPHEVDFEGELAVVIGKKAKEVSEPDALRYILGYTCANDVSARDCQKRRDKQWARAKSFDTFCPLGPELVTADSLSPASLRIRTLLNGRVMQHACTSSMIFSVPALVSYLSHQFTLLPGTVILTGTPAGVGFARSPQVFLRSGDNVAVEIEGIGVLGNPVVRR